MPMIARHVFMLCLLFPFALIHAGEYKAILQWDRLTALGMPVSGRIQSVSVRPGQHVRKGQRLLRLDPRPFEARIAQTRAELKAARQDAAEAARELKRSKELFERTVISVRDLQLVQIAHARARSARINAAQRYRLAMLDHEYSRLDAPFDAIVVRRQVEPGQVVVSRLRASPLIVLASADSMLAVVHVDAATAAKRRPGDKARVRVDGRDYAGRVRAITDLGAGHSPRYRIDVVFRPAPRKGLVAGLPAVVSLP